MDFEQNDNQSIPPQAPQPQPVYIQAPPPKRRTIRKILWFIFTIPFVIVSILLFLGLMSLAAFFIAGREGIYVEEVIQPGPHTAKIAIVNLQAIIDDRNAKEFYKQIKQAGEDDNVKALIIRVNSPGGMVSASDRINNEICQYKYKTQKPVVAFMQGLATSGGYYTSVAADRIVAEPTAITGSVGVIFGHLVVRQLLEEKLGIQPVIIKSGEKKDWPSPFSETTDEQRKYIMDKLIGPAYERFVQIIADQRPALELDDVKRLADGSIYTAAEAMELKMIDHIGYLDEAIERAKKLADIEEAKVVEYKKPFSLVSFLAPADKALQNRPNNHLRNNHAAAYVSVDGVLDTRSKK